MISVKSLNFFRYTVHVCHSSVLSPGPFSILSSPPMPSPLVMWEGNWCGQKLRPKPRLLTKPRSLPVRRTLISVGSSWEELGVQKNVQYTQSSHFICTTRCCIYYYMYIGWLLGVCRLLNTFRGKQWLAYVCFLLYVIFSQKWNHAGSNSWI